MATPLDDVRIFLRSALSASALADLNTASQKAPGGYREEPDGSFTFTHDGERFRVSVERLREQ